MIDPTELYKHALEIATQAHSGQYDKPGEPYIYHPLRVVSFLNTDSQLLKCIGILHDFYEDCDYDKYDLSIFPDLVINILDLLTHHKIVSYKRYIKNLSTSSLATKVKIADLMDNTNPDRLDEIYKTDPKTALRLAKKYVWALEYLTKKQKERGIKI